MVCLEFSLEKNVLKLERGAAGNRQPAAAKPSLVVVKTEKTTILVGDIVVDAVITINSRRLYEMRVGPCAKPGQVQKRTDIRKYTYR